MATNRPVCECTEEDYRKAWGSLRFVLPSHPPKCGLCRRHFAPAPDPRELERRLAKAEREIAKLRGENDGNECA